MILRAAICRSLWGVKPVRLAPQTNAMEIAKNTDPAVRPVRLIRLPEVIAGVGIKRSMICRLMGEGRFPRSRSLGPECAVWVDSEIDDWVRTVADVELGRCSNKVEI
jgi:prophage regulatory protein